MLEAEDLTVARGRRTLLEGFAVRVRPGELVHVAGPNGCGKSSLLRVLAGVVEPRRGSVVRRAPCVYAPEQAALPESLPSQRWLRVVGAGDAELPAPLGASATRRRSRSSRSTTSFVTQTFTGAQVLDVLKDQWCGTNSSLTLLLPSSTLHYTYDQSIAASILGKPCEGAANPVSGVTFNGTALDPAASYRITTNNFLADGGDDFLSLKAGTDRTTLSDFDIDSLVRYLATTSPSNPIGPPALDRIDVTPEAEPRHGAAVALRHRRPVRDNRA